MKYTFEPMDAAAVEVTREAWKLQLLDAPNAATWARYDSWLSYLARDVEGTQEHQELGPIERGDGSGAVYGVFKNGDSERVALAIVNLTHSRRGTQGCLKVLDMAVAPQFDACQLGDDDAEDDEREQLVVNLSLIAARAILGAIEASISPEFESDEIKIYGDVPLTSEFLTATATALTSASQLEKFFRVSREGRWMVVRKRPQAEGS